MIAYSDKTNVDTGWQWFPMWYLEGGSPSGVCSVASVHRVLVARRKIRGDIRVYTRLPDRTYQPNQFHEVITHGMRRLYLSEMDAWTAYAVWCRDYIRRRQAELDEASLSLQETESIIRMLELKKADS